MSDIRSTREDQFYVHSLLCIIMFVQVYSISPSFVPRVMFRLIEYVMDEISRLYQCVQEFSDNGALQVSAQTLYYLMIID